MRKLSVGRATAKQREFWAAPQKFVLYRGGVGSGKTFASVVKAFAMPAGSVGMMVAPTYPMLRDATLATFLQLARRGRILRSFSKADGVATLAGGRTVLFRTANDPDRLRGPNLGWFNVGEAALCDPETWPIMIGRLRLPPRLGWLDTTPRGNRNWTHGTFTKGGPSYRTVVASTRDAFWHPAEFVGSMEANYTADFARQEIDGEVLDDHQEGLIRDDWLDRMESAELLATVEKLRRAGRGGPRRIGADLGYGTGRDSFVGLARDDLGILDLVESSYVGVDGAALVLVELARKWGVVPAHVVYDANGPGRDMPKYLDPFGFDDAVGYYGAGKGGNFAVLRRDRVFWRVRNRLDPTKPRFRPGDPPAESPFAPVPRPGEFTPQEPFVLPRDRPWWPRMREELHELKYEMVARRVKLELKEDLTARLKRSPDRADALGMSFDDGECEEE